MTKILSFVLRARWVRVNGNRAADWKRVNFPFPFCDESKQLSYFESCAFK